MTSSMMLVMNSVKTSLCLCQLSVRKNKTASLQAFTTIDAIDLRQIYYRNIALPQDNFNETK